VVLFYPEASWNVWRIYIFDCVGP